MEYVWSDKDGRTREFFDSRDDAIEALREEQNAQPGITAGWMLLTYDDDGQEVGEPEWAEDLLPTDTVVSFVTVAEGVGLFVAGPRAESSGRVASTRRGFRRPPSVARGTRVLSEAETVAG
jgi:hypothetical protein